MSVLGNSPRNNTTTLVFPKSIFVCIIIVKKWKRGNEMEYLFNGEFSYIMIVVLAIAGLISNCIRYFGLKTFLKESNGMHKSENKSIRRIREIFLDKLKNHQGEMNEIDVHNSVDKSLFLLKTCGFNLLSINGICKKIIILVASSTVFISGFGLYSGWEMDRVVVTLLIGGLCTILLITFEMGNLFKAKKEIICINIGDYFYQQLNCYNEIDENESVEEIKEIEECKITEFPKTVSLKNAKVIKDDENDKINKEVIRKVFSDALYEAAFEKVEKKASEPQAAKDNDFIDALIREMLR